MLILLTGIIIIIGIHLIPGFPALRTQLINYLGEWPYKGLFSVISLTGLLLIIWGWKSADLIPLWEPPAWGRYFTLTFMPICFVLIVAAYMPSNIKRFTPHPMLWGIVIWAAVHLTANGDLASIILFGSFSIYALLDIWLINLRNTEKFEAVIPISKDIMTIVLGASIYLLLLFGHPYLSGVAIIG